MGYSSYTIYIMKSINNNKYLICLSLCACVHVHYLALLLLFYILFKYLCHKKGGPGPSNLATSFQDKSVRVQAVTDGK